MTTPRRIRRPEPWPHQWEPRRRRLLMRVRVVQMRRAFLSTPEGQAWAKTTMNALAPMLNHPAAARLQAARKAAGNSGRAFTTVLIDEWVEA